MADKIELEIVTPKGKALGASTDEVRAPSVGGEFGVLPGHLPLLAAVRTGIVTYRVGAEEKRCAVGPGFAEVGGGKVLILTDECVERDGVDPVVVRKELAAVQAEITKLSAEATTSEAGSAGAIAAAELRVLIAKENWLAAELELYGDPPPATMRPQEEWGPPAPTDEEDIPQASTGDA